MRAPLVAALMLLPLVPLAHAQTGGELLQDKAGDAVFTSGVPGVAAVPLNAAGQTESIDLLALDLFEADDDFTLLLKVTKLEGNPGGTYLVNFVFRDAHYRVLAQRSTNTLLSNFQVAYLEVALDEEGSDFERVAPLPIVADFAQSTLSVTVPKVFVMDGKDRIPTRGDVLKDIHVRADSGLFRFSIDDGAGYPGGYHDVMPDESEGATFTFTMGDLASGHLSLTTPDRVRVSNGGSTTFVYQAILKNSGPADDEVELALADMPEGWNGSIQTPVKIPAGAEKPIAVLASVPFEHKHGGFDSFNVTAVSKRDPNARATVRLGVVHTPIPQPAGHHSELYLHAQNLNGGAFGSVFPFARGFMNTESTHDGEAAGVHSNSGRNGARGWFIPLNPSLQMGLDFDVERIGELVGSIVGKTNGETSVSAKLYLYRMDGDETEEVVLAESNSQKITLDLQKAAPFKLTLTPTEDADYVPYAQDQSLALYVSMKTDGPCCFNFGGSTTPELMVQDFKLTLPLNEYHDRLTGTGETLEDLQLVADGLVEKVGRPGSVMTYAFDLKNNGQPMTVILEVAGNDAELGVVVPRGAIELATGETRRVTLAVQVPGDAATGEELEALVFAHAKDDPSKSAIARTLTTVSTGAAAQDDESAIFAAAAAEENDTPGFVPALATLALAGVALALRRR